MLISSPKNGEIGTAAISIQHDTWQENTRRISASLKIFKTALELMLTDRQRPNENVCIAPVK